MSTIYKSIEFVIETCVKCSTVWAMLDEFIDKKRKDHKTFYCPKGHPQYYPWKSDEEKLKDQVAHCKSDIEFWKDGYDAKDRQLGFVDRSRRAYKGQVTKLRKALSPENGNGGDDQ